MKSSRAVLALVASAALALSACGGDDDPSSSSSGSGGSGGGNGEPEVTELTVGALPISDYAAVYWAQENGFFEEEGLDITIEPVPSGAQSAQMVATGDLDIGYSHTIATSIGTQSGLPIKVIAVTSALGPNTLSIYVDPSSPIQSVEDLEGQTIGINALNTVGDITFRNMIAEDGLEVEPNWVEVPFPEMLSGVQSGSIDAGYAPEPFNSAARLAGMREVVNLIEEGGPNDGLAVANFVASDQFIGENPNTVAAFVRALYAAGADITANEAGFREWLPGVINVDPDVAQSMGLPYFIDHTDVDQLQRVADVLIDQGLLEDGYDAAEYTYTVDG
ncbi:MULTISPECIES: ABC transporter substrate-binding protein [unclassified Blastococcus]